MLPLYKPESERTSTRKALVRALERLVDYMPEHRDPDDVQAEPLIFFAAHVFALPSRRVALAVVALRSDLRKPEAERVPDYITKKATSLLAASSYFPQT